MDGETRERVRQAWEEFRVAVLALADQIGRHYGPVAHRRALVMRKWYGRYHWQRRRRLGLDRKRYARSLGWSVRQLVRVEMGRRLKIPEVVT